MKHTVNRRLIAFIAGLLCIMPAHSQKITGVTTAEPLTYESMDGRLKVLSEITFSSPLLKGQTLTLNGETLPFDGGAGSDRAAAWMPMIGGCDILELTEGGKTVSSFGVTAPIEKDWGIFSEGEIHLLQSSHQDIAWMDTPDYCRQDRIDNIIIPALGMMRNDPDITFEMEQTLNLMEFLQAHPERKDEVIQRYREGRFLWGATYNQPYEGLSSGEQLARQTVYGRKWIKDHLPGCDDFTASNMDVPGRAMQYPQILAKSGLKYLFISRMKEGLFDWSSPDGTSILTYSLGHYGWEKFVWHFFDSGVVNAYQKVRDRLRLWEAYYAEHHLPPHYAVLMSNDASKPDSYSDLIDSWNDIASKAEVSLPRLRYSTIDRYLSTMDTPEASREQISGERPDLWLYIHGPAHYRQTVDKRRAGVLLPAAELFSTVNWLSGGTYPSAELTHGWMASIYPDHGLGGKNGEITDAVFSDSLRVGRMVGEEVMRRETGSITAGIKGKKGDLILFNDLPWDRTSIAEVPVPYSLTEVRNSRGETVPSQTFSRGDSLFVRFPAQVPSAGYASFSIAPARKPTGLPEYVSAGENHYSNKWFDALLGDGGIVSLIDRSTGRNLLENERLAFGDILDAEYRGNGAGEFTRITDLTIYLGAPLLSSRHRANWKKTDEGSVFVTYENSYEDPYARIIQRITFYNDIRKIDFDVRLENFTGEHNRQYRILFPLNMKLARSDIRYEVPMAVSKVGRDELGIVPGGYGSWGTYVHHPKDSHPREIQNFISASGNGFGVTMSSCVAVGDWIDPSLEVADYPVLQGILLSSHKSCHGEGNWYHQTGTHDFHFSIFPHGEGWLNGYCDALAENHPLYASFKTDSRGRMPSEHSYISISDPLVSISAFKKADDDGSVIIRIVEMEGIDKDVTITLPFEVSGAEKCSIIEESLSPVPLAGRTLTLHVGHNAIETYKLFPAGK